MHAEYFFIIVYTELSIDSNRNLMKMLESATSSTVDSSEAAVDIRKQQEYFKKLAYKTKILVDAPSNLQSEETEGESAGRNLVNGGKILESTTSSTVDSSEAAADIKQQYEDLRRSMEYDSKVLAETPPNMQIEESEGIHYGNVIYNIHHHSPKSGTQFYVKCLDFLNVVICQVLLRLSSVSQTVIHQLSHKSQINFFNLRFLNLGFENFGTCFKSKKFGNHCSKFK